MSGNVIYVRVGSNEDTHSSRNGIDAQVSACEADFGSHGSKSSQFTHIFDIGVDDVELRRREGLLRALREVSTPGTICVATIDRISSRHAILRDVMAEVSKKQVIVRVADPKSYQAFIQTAVDEIIDLKSSLSHSRATLAEVQSADGTNGNDTGAIQLEASKRFVPLQQTLRDALRERGLSINAIAIQSAIPQPVLHRFYRGERDLKLSTVDKLCRFLRLTLIPLANMTNHNP